ncbi:probable NAD(P)H dehydrogenase (quinone) FQR1-like 2 [Salvia miltiorrhiza]|uniref:probable NAD(P)H dehydrogenase (quinone) FQR1-like 2 n=1 Tax=Salvia miltiorrhiza TaxID=226208 RepID=UPI0025AD8343|nr:probable NAD(P)H dehydrogenase (quinone) FQR1-like 2 [Salvia miltiorrhiza]
MGKGGGCIPSKHKASAAIPNQTAALSVSERSISFEGQSPRKLRILIVFYSMYGHVEALAREMKEGVDEVEGVEGVLYRIPETLAPQALEQMQVPPKDDGIPVISAEQLVEADGLLFGFPARYGSMAAQMKAFFDSTGALWRDQKLAGVPAGFFVGTGTQGGGQETTAWTAITQLAHHGMVYVPIGYTFEEGMWESERIRGGSPYGAGVISGDGTTGGPSQTELALAHHQAKYMASIVKRFAIP